MPSAADPPQLLWPAPRSLRPTEGVLDLGRHPVLSVSAGDPALRAPADRLVTALAGLGLRARIDGSPSPETPGPPFRLGLRPGGAPESYRLAVSPTGAELRAADPAGLHHAVSTLAQWLRVAGEGPPGGPPRHLPALEVDDAPSFPVRGVMLDVSRDKVPTLETLFGLADRLAGWKINQLQLYTEHTFAYRGHEVVWEGASPLTPGDVRALDRHCAARGIELVPNQNSFGHFHRWLRHEAYRPLAEVPEGVEHPFGEAREPFSLCPVDPASLDLLADLYDQLLPCFASHRVNVGLDETFDLGRGRSAAACEEVGRGRVYLRFLRAVHGLLAERDHRMLFWGDIIVEHPELIPELPADAVALDWGYEADHPFDDELSRFAAAGLEFWVCPGTSSWNSLGGRLDNALVNLARAVAAARRHGAGGILVTDWGDFGHLQPLPVSYPGMLVGAGLAWNADAAPALDVADPTAALPLAELLAHHALGGGCGTARALVELGLVHAATGARPRNASALFHLLLFPHRGLDDPRWAGLAAAGLEDARDRLRALRAALAAPVGGAEPRLAQRELEWVRGLLLLAVRLGRARLEAGGATPEELPPAVRRELRAALAPLVEEHRPVWRARNRPGGRADSVARLERLLALLG